MELNQIIWCQNLPVKRRKYVQLSRKSSLKTIGRWHKKTHDRVVTTAKNTDLRLAKNVQ